MSIGQLKKSFSHFFYFAFQSRVSFVGERKLIETFIQHFSLPVIFCSICFYRFLKFFSFFLILLLIKLKGINLNNQFFQINFVAIEFVLDIESFFFECFINFIFLSNFLAHLSSLLYQFSLRLIFYLLYIMFILFFIIFEL